MDGMSTRQNWRRIARVLGVDQTAWEHIDYIAFDAAGSKGFLYVGVMEVMEAFLGTDNGDIALQKVEMCLRDRLKGAVGVSAGALAALCIALGLSSQHLYEAYVRMMAVQRQKMSIANLIMGKQTGMTRSEALEPCVAYLLESAAMPYDATFADVYTHGNSNFILHVSSYDQVNHTPVFYSNRTTPSKRVLDAVVESMCVPLLFTPREYSVTEDMPNSSNTTTTPQTPQTAKTSKMSKTPKTPKKGSHPPPQYIDGWFAGMDFNGVNLDATMIVYSVSDAASRALHRVIPNRHPTSNTPRTPTLPRPAHSTADVNDYSDDDADADADADEARSNDSNDSNENSDNNDDDDDSVDMDEKTDTKRDGDDAHTHAHVLTSFLTWYTALQLRMTRLVHALLPAAANENKLEIIWDENFITAGSTPTKRAELIHAGGIALLNKYADPTATLGNLASALTSRAMCLGRQTSTTSTTTTLSSPPSPSTFI